MSTVDTPEAVRAAPKRQFLALRGNRKWPLLLALEIVALLGLWQYATGTLELVDPAFLPPPTQIAHSLYVLVTSASFLPNLAFTLVNYVIGLVIACVAGIALGLIIGWYLPVNRLFAPLAWLGYSIPKVAIAPIIILMLGLGASSKIAMVVLLVFFVVLTNTMEGAGTVDRSYVAAARVFGLSDTRMIYKIVMPATLPYIFAGLERAVAIGIIGEILGEYLGSTQGIGVILQRAGYDFRMDDAFAVVVVMVAITVASRAALRISLRLLAPWYRGTTGSGQGGRTN